MEELPPNLVQGTCDVRGFPTLVYVEVRCWRAARRRCQAHACRRRRRRRRRATGATGTGTGIGTGTALPRRGAARLCDGSLPPPHSAAQGFSMVVCCVLALKTHFSYTGCVAPIRRSVAPASPPSPAHPCKHGVGGGRIKWEGKRVFHELVWNISWTLWLSVVAARCAASFAWCAPSPIARGRPRDVAERRRKSRRTPAAHAHGPHARALASRHGFSDRLEPAVVATWLPLVVQVLDALGCARPLSRRLARLAFPGLQHGVPAHTFHD